MYLLRILSTLAQMSSRALLVVLFVDYGLLIWLGHNTSWILHLNLNIIHILLTNIHGLLRRLIILNCLHQMVWIQYILCRIADLVKMWSICLAHVLSGSRKPVEVKALLRGAFKIIILHHVVAGAVASSSLACWCDLAQLLLSVELWNVKVTAITTGIIAKLLLKTGPAHVKRSFLCHHVDISIFHFIISSALLMLQLLLSLVVHGSVNLLSDMDTMLVFQEVLGRRVDLVRIQARIKVAHCLKELLLRFQLWKSRTIIRRLNFLVAMGAVGVSIITIWACLHDLLILICWCSSLGIE